jgi:AAA family ATPase
MASGQKFTVRPFSKPGRSDLNDAFRIYLSPTALLSLKLRSGDSCSILPEGSPARTAISWTAAEKIQDTVVQTSKVVQDLYGFRLGDKVSIVKADIPVPEVDVVTLEEAPKDHVDVPKGESTSSIDKTHWEWFLEHPLLKAQYICAGMQLDQVELKGQRKSFVVRALSSDIGSPMQDLFRFSEQSRVQIREDLPSDPVVSSISFNLESMLHGVGGLKRQIKQINSLLHDFDTTAPTMAMPPYYHGNSGIMFYGPKGTGKTLVLKRITTGPWRKVFNITGSIMSGNEGSGEKRVREIFATAHQFEPSVISIDQLEFLAPKRKFSDSFSSPTLAPILCEVLDSLNGSQVLIIAATRHPNDVDETLRTPSRFGVEVELPVPNAMDRKDILQAIRGSSDLPSDILIDFAAEKTHGFVGADLFALLQVACRKGRTRCIGTGLEPITNGDKLSQSEQTQPMQPLPFKLMEQDIAEALIEVRPTAMREVVLETPRTRWSDIGGQHEVKLRLQKAVKRPLKVSPSKESSKVNTNKFTDGRENEDVEHQQPKRHPTLRPTRLLQNSPGQSPRYRSWPQFPGCEGCRNAKHVRGRVRTSFERDIP